MHSAIRVLLWERWRRTWWAVVLVMFCLALTPIAVANRYRDYLEEPLILAISPFMALLFCVLIAGLSERDRIDGALPRRILRLPLSTTALTGVHVGYGVVIVGIACVCAEAMAHFCRIDTPGTARVALLVFAGFSVVQAVALVGGPRMLSVACGLSIFAPAAAGVLVYLVRDTMVLHPAGIGLLCLAVMGLGFALSTLAVSQQRHGARLAIIDYLSVTAYELPWRKRRFRSAAQAQTWYEWRMIGWRLPVVALMLPLGYLAFTEVTYGRQWPGTYDMSMLLLLGTWFVSLSLFATRHNERVSGSWSFVMSRPMTTRALASCRFRAAARSILAAAIAFAVMVVLSRVVTYVGVQQRDSGILRELQMVFPRLTAGRLLACSLGLILVVWTLYWLGLELFLWFLGLMAFHTVVRFAFSLAGLPADALYTLIGISFYGAFVIAAIWLYWRALIHGLIAWKAAGVAIAAAPLVAAGWAALSVFTEGTPDKGNDSVSTLGLILDWAAITAIPLIPPAYVPLMMARHRHR